MFADAEDKSLLAANALRRADGLRTIELEINASRTDLQGQEPIHSRDEAEGERGICREPRYRGREAEQMGELMS
jgi:hypothetical protein